MFPFNNRLQLEFHHKVVANKRHMSMFVVKSIVVQINVKVNFMDLSIPLETNIFIHVLFYILLLKSLKQI